MELQLGANRAAEKVEAIREEWGRHVGELILLRMKEDNAWTENDLWRIARDAGKPTLKKGQVVGYIVHNPKWAETLEYVYKPDGGVWSDLCDETKESPGHDYWPQDGPVFLREAMDE